MQNADGSRKERLARNNTIVVIVEGVAADVDIAGPVTPVKFAIHQLPILSNFQPPLERLENANYVRRTRRPLYPVGKPKGITQGGRL